MRLMVLSRRYAEALADVAERSGQLEKVRAELNALAETFAASDHLRTFARTARQSRSAKKSIFRALSEKLRLSGPTSRLLQYLVQKRRTGILEQLAESYADEADRRLGIATAHVTSAVPLSDAHRARIQAGLQDITGKTVRMFESIDESLIGGFQARLDGLFFDGSLQGQLQRIRETIAHGG